MPPRKEWEEYVKSDSKVSFIKWLKQNRQFKNYMQNEM